MRQAHVNMASPELLPVSTPSQVGTVADFNGTTHFLDSIESHSLATSTPHTLFLHCRYSGTMSSGLPDGLYGLFNLGLGGIGYWYSANNGLIATYTGAVGTNYPTSNLDVSLWHRWVFVFPGSANPTVYCDGINVNATGGPNLTADTDGRITIGRGLGTSFYGKTQLESAVLFEEALTAEQVHSISAGNQHWTQYSPMTNRLYFDVAAASGRIMSSLTRHGGLAGSGGIAGHGGGLAS